MAKDQQYYFSHDVNASSDPKIVAMEMEFGVVAYAWWWKIIERLAIQDGYKLPFKRYIFASLADDFRLSDEHIRTHVEQNGTGVQTNVNKIDFVHLFINCLISDFELLEKDDEFFWSPSLLRRYEMRKSKELEVSEKRRQAGLKSGEARRKNKQNLTHVEHSGTHVQQNELRKEKKRKEYIEEREIRARNSDNPNKPVYDLYMKKLGDISPVIKERLDDLIASIPYNA